MRLWMDADGCIWDSNDKWFEWINKTIKEKYQAKYPGSYMMEIFLYNMKTWSWVRDFLGEEYMEFWKTPGVYKDLVKPFPGVEEFVEDFCYHHGKPVNFITSTYPGMEDEKDNLIRETFGWCVGDIVHHWEKHKFLVEGDIIIEDNKDNIWNHVIKNAGYGILFNFQQKHPYANFDPEYIHPRIYYSTTFNRMADIVDDLFYGEEK